QGCGDSKIKSDLRHSLTGLRSAPILNRVHFHLPQYNSGNAKWPAETAHNKRNDAQYQRSDCASAGAGLLSGHLIGITVLRWRRSLILRVWSITLRRLLLLTRAGRRIGVWLLSRS